MRELRIKRCTVGRSIIRASVPEALLLFDCRLSERPPKRVISYHLATIVVGRPRPPLRFV